MKFKADEIASVIQTEIEDFRGQIETSEVGRVLVPGGLYAMVSFQQPHFRRAYLLGQHMQRLDAELAAPAAANADSVSSFVATRDQLCADEAAARARRHVAAARRGVPRRHNGCLRRALRHSFGAQQLREPRVSYPIRNRPRPSRRRRLRLEPLPPS